MSSHRLYSTASREVQDAVAAPGMQELFDKVSNAVFRGHGLDDTTSISTLDAATATTAAVAAGKGMADTTNTTTSGSLQECNGRA
jgi:hypothetical protein